MANEIGRYPIPLILKKIYKDGLSGELRVTGTDGSGFEKRFFFNNGILDFATTTVRDERLGQILFQKGKISEEVLLRVNIIKSQEKIRERIGKTLIKITSLTEEDIYYTLNYQIKKIATNTFPLGSGEWMFLKTVPKIPNSKRAKINLSKVIHDGVRKIKDLSYYREKFKNCSPITTTMPDDIRELLTSEELDMFKQLSRGSERTLNRIISESQYSAQIYWQTIIMYYLMSIMAISSLNLASEEINQLKYEVNELHEKIEKNAINFYEILGINQNTNHEERKAKYLSLISRFHPDKFSSVSNPVFDEKIDQVVATINTAYQILCDPQRKAQYDQKGENLTEVAEEKEALDEKILAKRLYRKAFRLHQEQKYNDSIYLVERAIAYDPARADYFLLLAQNQSHLPLLKRKAESNFKKAAQLEPWNPNPYYAMGLMFKNEKLLKKAEACFKKALEIDMEHTLSIKSLRDLKNRRSSFLHIPSMGRKK